MISNSMRIAIAEIKSQIHEDASLDGALRSSMHLARHHWLINDDQDRFKTAVGAVMLHFGPSPPTPSKPWPLNPWSARDALSNDIIALNSPRSTP